MGHRGFGRQWSAHADQQWEPHGRRGWGGPPWGGFGPHGFGRPGNPGPPPWVAGLFGLAQGERQRGPRVRRGDVRSAILDVVRSAQWNNDTINGYQVIQQIAERSNGAWRPSPGSVYPTIQQLEDEGLVETAEVNGRRSLRLTDAGTEYAAANDAELAAVWAPFEAAGRDREDFGDGVDLRPEIGQVMNAVWQIVTTGTDAQRQAAVDVLVDARRRLYGILADGDDGDDGTAEAEDA
jgi:DNA-binding PadR family transcriptional regulator